MSETMEQNLAATTTAQPAPSLDQLTLEVKFYLGQTAQNVIEVGKRLAQAKGMLPHGEFGGWLENNFGLSQSSANKFMAVAERFGKSESIPNLKPTQMIAMLSLPADETEQFIEDKAAAGTPVEDMTIRTLHKEIEQWKSRAEVNENAVTEKEQRISQLASNFNSLQNEKAQLQRDLDDALNQLKNQKPVIQAPADYEHIMSELAKLRNEKAALQNKLDNSNAKRLAELDAKIADMQKQIDAQISAE
ncbi:MAG: DUF3102 domain-containing protein, partial [Selenomonadaceae bacterium]|nr:DUF3102 domain-containing protein [Selenomonadaceae bacterium]